MLPGFSPKLSGYVAEALTQLSAEVRCGALVIAYDDSGIRFGEMVLPACTVNWATGAQASKAAR